MIMDEEMEFKKFIEDNGPNRGQGFFGQWAWYQMMRDRFDEMQSDLEKSKIDEKRSFSSNITKN